MFAPRRISINAVHARLWEQGLQGGFAAFGALTQIIQLLTAALGANGWQWLARFAVVAVQPRPVGVHGEVGIAVPAVGDPAAVVAH